MRLVSQFLPDVQQASRVPQCIQEVGLGDQSMHSPLQFGTFLFDHRTASQLFHQLLEACPHMDYRSYMFLIYPSEFLSKLK